MAPLIDDRLLGRDGGVFGQGGGGEEGAKLRASLSVALLLPDQRYVEDEFDKGGCVDHGGGEIE